MLGVGIGTAGRSAAGRWADVRARSYVVFEEDKMERLGCCLRRLLPHLDGEDAALTGSAAINVHLSARHLPQSRAADDVDFVARRRESVSASVTREFLVSHFHLPQPGYRKWLVQLVDPQFASPR